MARDGSAGNSSGRGPRWRWPSPLPPSGWSSTPCPIWWSRWLARIPSNEGMRATVKLIGCFFLFAAVYVGFGIAIGEAFGPGWGLLAAGLAPACGYAAVRVAERVRRIGGAVEGYRAAPPERAAAGGRGRGPGRGR